MNLKQIDLPRDARAMMKFHPDFVAAIDAITREAERDARWETTQDVPIVIDSPDFLAYWIHKTAKPIVRAMLNSGVEEQLKPFKQTNFDLLPAGFEVDSEVTLSASGDLMCTKGIENAKDSFYEDVAEIIFGADIAFANLESTLTTGQIDPIALRVEEAPRINLSPAQYETLIGYRGRCYDIVQLANNHILDCGEEGIRTTLGRLKSDGIIQVGVNESAEGALQPQIYELRGLRIGWVAHTHSVNFKPFPQGQAWLVNMTPFHLETNPDVSAIERQIQACRDAGCDLVFVALHWGLEFEFYPHPDQLKWARRFADAGADAVIGHHPHVVQPLEIYRPPLDPTRAVPIMYSLGNLTPVLSNAATVLSLVARLRLVKGRLGAVRQTRIAGLNLTPVAVMSQPSNGQDLLRLVRLNRLFRQEELDTPTVEYVAQISAYADLVLGTSWRVGAVNSDGPGTQ